MSTKISPVGPRVKFHVCETAEELDNLFELSASTKLSNTDILRQFDAKLTHLQPSQQEDRRELIREYFMSHLTLCQIILVLLYNLDDIR